MGGLELGMDCEGAGVESDDVKGGVVTGEESDGATEADESTSTAEERIGHRMPRLIHACPPSVIHPPSMMELPSTMG